MRTLLHCSRVPWTRSLEINTLHNLCRYTYWSELDRMLTSHPAHAPLFLYLSIHMVHEPYQGPESFQAIYAHAPLCAQRKMLQAMVSVVDALVHNVTSKMNSTATARSYPTPGSGAAGFRTLWDDTIFVFVRCPVVCWRG